MSETVKLIIEIPKGAYLACRALKTDNDQGILTFCVVNAVADGTPLDDVKAEIRELRDSWEKDCYHDEAEALNIALKIIDKHIGKGDKE